MKIPIFNRLRRLRWLAWSCLWAIPISFLLLSRPAIAQEITFDDPDMDPATPLECVAAGPHTFTVNEGDTINESINLVNAPSDVDWDFDLPPTPVGAGSCSGSGDTYTCSGIDISIPAGVVSGASSANVDSGGMPATPLGNYAFALQVDDETPGGTASCTRDYNLDVVEADIPFDLAFVLDRSGSMNSSADPNDAAGDSRWEVLQSTIAHFAGDLVGFNDEHASPTDNNVGLTLFATNVLSNTVLPNALTSIDSSLPTDVTDELDQSPGGLTAMGSGLQTALERWDASLPVDTDTTRSRVVVLFTDGRQNQNPRVNLDGQGFNDGQDINDSTGDGSVKIITIGVGGPDNDYLDTLQNLAANNRGVYASTADGQAFDAPAISWNGTLEETFENVIAPALSSNSPLMIASFEERLTPGGVKLPEFAVNFNAKQLVIDFLFERKLERPELEELLKNVQVYRDGEDISRFFTPRITADYTQWASLVTDYTLTDNAGTTQTPSAGNYIVALIKPEKIEDLNFQAFPFADDDHLEATWGIEPTIPRVGEPMKIYADLQWRQQPVKEAIVEATILEPGSYVGDLLAKNPLVVDANADQRDVPLGVQKYLALLAENPEFAKQLAFKPRKIELKHQGNGQYVGTYTPAMPGSMQIFIETKGKDPERGSQIQRLFFLSKNTRLSAIDPDASNITTRFDNGAAVIDWQPMTVNGLLVGPGNDAAFSFQGAERTRIQDDQRGGYQVLLDGVRPESKIIVSYLGDEIYRGTLCQFGKPQFGAINLEASKIRTQVDDNGVAAINWRPVNERKRPIGSGNAQFIEILGAEQTKIQDNGEGNYTMTLLGVKPTSQISVRLSCNEIYRGALSEFGGTAIEPPCRGWFCRFRNWRRLMPWRTVSGVR